MLDLHRRWRRLSAWSREAIAALLALGVGGALMPLLIFFAGAALLGRYDGASAARIYDTVYGGLRSGAASSWIVLLGPYVLYLLARALAAGWRAAGTRAR